MYVHVCKHARLASLKLHAVRLSLKLEIVDRQLDVILGTGLKTFFCLQ